MANTSSPMTTVMHPEGPEDVFRVAAYHRREFAFTVVYSDPQKLSAVQPFISEPFPRPPSAHLGKMGCLPSELLQDIFSYLDVLSSFRLRQVNRVARGVVSTWPAYQDLSRHALEALRTALRTGIAGWLLVSGIHRALRRSKCSQCDFFGPLLFLPTVERCCHRCLESSSNFRIASLTALSQVSGLTPSRLREWVPVLHTLPGRYSMRGSKYKLRLNMVAQGDVLQRLSCLNIQPPLPTTIPHLKGRNSAYRCTMATAFPFIDDERPRVQEGLGCRGCLATSEASGLSDRDITLQQRDRSYSRKEFLIHLELCEAAQKIWQASHRGVTGVSSTEPVCISYGGFISEAEAKEYYK